MKEQRRHLPMLEALDLRIVPSTVGITPVRPAVAAEHAAVVGAVHVTKVHHPVQTHAHAHTKHHAKVHPAPTGSTTPVSTAPVVSYGAASATPAVAIGSSAAATDPVTPTAAATATAATTSATATAPTNATTAAAPATPVATPSATSTFLTQAAANATTTTTTVPTTTTTTTTGSSDIGNPETGPLAKAGVDLITIYQEFEAQGGSSTFTSSEAGIIKIKGTSVGIEAHMSGGTFQTYLDALAGLGMQVESVDPTHGIVEGFLPISQLPAAAQNAQTQALSAIYVPKNW
jgi:hypothetical protein